MSWTAMSRPNHVILGAAFIIADPSCTGG